MTEDEKFLKRWSRRKASIEQPAPHPPLVAKDGVESAAISADIPADGETEDNKPGDIDLDALPDIDSMDENSDFSVFMQGGIPEALRTRALRKLWQTDPAFNVVDGLVEYGEDFTDLGAVAEGVKTAYKVGKGMVDDDDEAEPDEAAVADAADDDRRIEHSGDAPKRDESDGNEAVNDGQLQDRSQTVRADDIRAAKKTEDG